MPDTKPRNRTWDKTPEAAKYRQSFRDNHYDRVELNLPAGMRSEIDREAKAAGLSRTAWILAAIEAYRKKEDD